MRKVRKKLEFWVQKQNSEFKIQIVRLKSEFWIFFFFFLKTPKNGDLTLYFGMFIIYDTVTETESLMAQNCHSCTEQD